MSILSIVLGILFVPFIALLIFTVGRRPRSGEDSENQTHRAIRYLYAALSITASFGLGILASYYGYAQLKINYALPFWANCSITFVIIIVLLAICGFAIQFVIPATNKNLAFAIILTSFLCLGTTGAIHYFRGDNFDPKTGACRLWVTPSTGKIWRDKPANTIFDPTTGEKIIKATPELLKKLRRRNSKQATINRQPAKSWQTIWGPKEFVGKGMGKNDYIYTAELGKDVKYGDRLIFLGKEFETWRNGGFKKFFNRHIVINRNSGVGGKFLIKAPKNQKVIVKVERLM